MNFGIVFENFFVFRQQMISAVAETSEASIEEMKFHY